MRSLLFVRTNEIEIDLGDIKFTGCTYRLFKSKSIADGSIEQGQFGYWITYIGNEKEFQWDESITFEVRSSLRYSSNDKRMS